MILCGFVFAATRYKMIITEKKLPQIKIKKKLLQINSSVKKQNYNETVLKNVTETSHRFRQIEKNKKNFAETIFLQIFQKSAKSAKFNLREN